MLVIVKLATATICFMNSCFPALVGIDTPVGQYQLNLRITEQVGYHGDVIQFKETDTIIYAIHRIWLLNDNENRLERLNNSDPKERIISKGCINVAPEVYEKLKECCILSSTLIIEQ